MSQTRILIAQMLKERDRLDATLKRDESKPLQSLDGSLRSRTGRLLGRMRPRSGDSLVARLYQSALQEAALAGLMTPGWSLLSEAKSAHEALLDVALEGASHAEDQQHASAFRDIAWGRHAKGIDALRDFLPALESCIDAGANKALAAPTRSSNTQEKQSDSARENPRLRKPNESTEQPVIDALFKISAIGLDGLQRIPRDVRPTGERLAELAIGRPCDGQFKTTLAHMVDLGWLGNGRHHGLEGGYFLTESGAALATKNQKKKPPSR
jgi:hypothetical protein